MFFTKYKVGDIYPKEMFKFKYGDSHNGMRYYEMVHWFGLWFLPMKHFVTLEIQNNVWKVISVENK